MATIHLSQNAFAPIQEGIHIFRIYDVEYDETFGRVQIHLVNAQGKTHIERFTLMRNDGSMIDGACNALSFFARIALQLGNDVTDIDHRDLIGRYIKAQVTHTTQPNRNDPSKTVTFVNLTDKWSADGFDTEPCEKALTLGQKPRKEAKPTETPEEKPIESGNLDLNTLLD